MRVLHLSAGNLYGGIERMLVTVAAERGSCPEMEPHFGLCFDGRVAEELRATGVPVYLLGTARFSRPWSVWQAQRQLRELLRNTTFDVVICHAAWPYALFARVARSSSRLAFWVHSPVVGRHWTERLAIFSPPDLVIANSRFSAAASAATFPETPIQVIHCPVAPTTNGDRAGSRSSIRRELGTSSDATVIVMASRLEPWKGHRALIDALRLLPPGGQWECWIAGGPQQDGERSYLQALERHARDLEVADRIRFLGQRSDIRRVLAAADIHCQPNSGAEPFGIAFIEALYAGLPVVTTKIGGAVEIVTEACGILVNVNEAMDLGNALNELITDSPRRRQLGLAGPARALELCNPACRLSDLHRILVGVAA